MIYKRYDLFKALSVFAFLGLCSVPAHSDEIDKLKPIFPSNAYEAGGPAVPTEGSLFLGSKRLNCTQIQTQIAAFNNEHQLQTGESVICEASTNKVLYKLRSDLSKELLEEYLTLSSDVLPVNFYPTVSKATMESFIADEGVIAGVENIRPTLKATNTILSSIHYKLFNNKAKRFVEIMNDVDTAPAQLLVQVKLISASKSTQNEFEGMFSANSPWGKPTTVGGAAPNLGKFLSKFTPASPLLNASFASPAVALSAALNALRQTGEGKRSIFADITTTDSSVEGWRPAKFSQTQNIPTVYESTQQGQTIKDNKIGLELSIDSITMLNSQDFIAEKQKFYKELEKYLVDNALCYQMIQNAFKNNNFDGLDLKALDQFFADIEQFKVKAKSINGLLKYLVKMTLKDGGATREIVTATTTAQATSETYYEMTQTLENGTPRFIGGTNGFQEKTSKTYVPVLGSIPVIRRLFQSESKNKSEDGVMGFLTVSTLEISSEKNAVRAYMKRGTEYVVPLSLGGLASDNPSTDALATAIPSNLKWLYDSSESILTARKKINSTVGEKLVGHLFAQKFYRALEMVGTSGAEWFDFNRLRVRLDQIQNSTKASHPIVSMIQEIGDTMRKISQNKINLTNTEILAIVRDQGRIGRGSVPDSVDERLVMYLAWLVAKNHIGMTSEDQSVFSTKSAIDDFEKNKFLVHKSLITTVLEK